MRDAEFVLRYLTFRDNWDSFRGGMMRRMDDFMADNQHLSGRRVEAAKQDFVSSLKAVDAGFGEHAFQRWVPAKKMWRRQVLASLYDAEMLASRNRAPDRLRANRQRIEAGLKALFSDEGFRGAIDAATNTPRLFQTRITMMAAMLDEALAE